MQQESSSRLGLLAVPRPISHADAQIAALAQVQGAKLATRNVDDFEDYGVEVVDPWKSLMTVPRRRA